MSLIKCPECGKEISDQAKSCPNCGFPTPKFKQYKNQTFDDVKSEMNTGVFGDNNIQCPVCGSRYFDIANDIPIYRKILEIWLIGTIMPQTKSKYREGMIYHCRKCDTVWNNEKIIKTGVPNGYNPSPALPIVVGIISILFSIILFVLSFTATIITRLLLMIAFFYNDCGRDCFSYVYWTGWKCKNGMHTVSNINNRIAHNVYFRRGKPFIVFDIRHIFLVHEVI